MSSPYHQYVPSGVRRADPPWAWMAFPSESNQGWPGRKEGGEGSGEGAVVVVVVVSKRREREVEVERGERLEEGGRASFFFSDFDKKKVGAFSKKDKEFS